VFSGSHATIKKEVGKMKKLTGLAAAAAAVIILVSGGQAFSAERQDFNYPNAVGDWQIAGPVEAGSLPKGEDLTKAKTGDLNAFAKVEYGGLVYRVGIDTN
jgi:hypothetical protein